MSKKYDTTSNVVNVTGTLVKELEFSHTLFGENFYFGLINIGRLGSENSDTLPITVSEKLIDVKGTEPGTKLYINGQFRSFNKVDEANNKRHLILAIFCKDIQIVSGDTDDNNSIELSGYICKNPIFRKTPKGREITDLLVAVNRSYGRTDYIPCIAWGRNAKFTAGMEIGTHLSLSGRIQSRVYYKKTEGDTYQEKTVYEVSLSGVSIIVDPEIDDTELVEE